MICRVCLEDSYNILNIFEESGKLYDIANILGKYLWFKPCLDDPISTAVCCDCWQSVHEFHQFYIKVEQAHTTFTSAHANIGISEVNVENKIFAEYEQPAAEQLEPSITIKEELVENICKEDLNYSDDVNATDGEIKDELNPLEDLETQVCSTEIDSNVYENLKVNSDNFTKGNPKLRIKSSNRRTSRTVSDGPTNCSKRHKKRAESHHEEGQDNKKTKLPIRRMSLENLTSNELDLIKKHIPMQCELCFVIADSYITFTDHFKTEHDGVKPYVQCCGRRLNRPFTFIQHALIHENPENNKCFICNKSFSEPSVLRTHTLLFHAKEQLKYACDQCPKRFLNRYNLKHHMPLHIPQDKWKFVCEQCPQPKHFPSDHLLQIHRNACHEKPVSMCHVCGKEFRYGPSFDKHVRSHFSTAAPRLKCTFPACNTWLKDELNLKIHLKRHEETHQTHACTQCNKEFKNRDALWGHMRYNHSNISFECTFCNKIFRKPRNLKEHMAAQHTGKFLYQCNFCDRSFRANSNLCTHRKKVHPVEYENWKKTKLSGVSTSIGSIEEM